MALPEAAVAYYQQQQQIGLSTLALARRVWSQLGPGDFDQAWQSLGPQLTVVLSAGQRAAVLSGAAFVPTVLDEMGVAAEADATVSVAPLVGVSSDGRPLGSLLYQSVIRTRTALGDGASLDDALSSGGDLLDAIVATQTADAARAAVSVASYVRPMVQGYIRVANSGCCPRCAVLAGKFTFNETAFLRHPSCFPAGVTVSGPRTAAAARRYYHGELVTIRTASGQELPATGNHPVLTDHGWVPANLIQEGDYVVRSTRGDGAVALMVPDHDQVPARIEDVWGSHSMTSPDRMPSATEDFHGDGGRGEVEVVFPYRDLRNGFNPALGQLVAHELFAGRIATAVGLTGQRSREQLGFGGLAATVGVVRSLGLSEAFLGCHLAGPEIHGGAGVANLHASTVQSAADYVSRNAVASAEAQFAFATDIRGNNGVGVEDVLFPRWDAPAGKFSMETRSAYADRGEDLRLRLAGQIEFDRVIAASSTQWSGHVYNLTSSEGWFSANGLIVSNCRCFNSPVDSPERAKDFPDTRDLIDAGEVRGLSQADTRAIVEDGADPARVINAHKGMATEQLFGQKVKTTNALSGQFGPVRLRPETLYKLAENREHALQLLEQFGYITN